MSLLMDALKRAEIIKKNAQYDTDTDGVESLPTHQETLENDQPIKKARSEWEEELSLLSAQEFEPPPTENITESAVQNWTDALLFDTDEDDTPLQLEAPPPEETPSPPIVWEDAILPEFDTNDQPIKQSVEEPAVLLVEDISATSDILSDVSAVSEVDLPENVQDAVSVRDDPLEFEESTIILGDEKPIETSETFSDTGENVEDVNFTEVSIHNDHLKFIDWVDNYIDEEALRATHVKGTQEKDTIDEELSLLEKFAEGTATHPSVAKRLLIARGKSPRLPKSTLRLLSLLGIVVIGLTGGFAYYYYSIDTSSNISFNKHAKFVPPPLPTDTKETVSVPEQPTEKIAEMPPISELPVEIPVVLERSVEEEVKKLEPPAKKIAELQQPTPSEKPAVPLKTPTESKTQLQNVTAEDKANKPIFPEETQQIISQLPSEEPMPVQTVAGIHTLHKTIKTLDNTKISKAYIAFQRGDTHTAQHLYTQILQTEPTNRDALLGLAGISLQQGHSAKAQYYYQRVLELYPQDKAGQIGLINTLNHNAPEYSESQLKVLLVDSPQASPIHFSLGNLYARQGQWAKAQHAYFSAYQYDTQHPDYAYNLAVSLDQINQPRLALSYYQKASQLIQQSQTTYHFNPQALQQRIRTLTAYYQ